MQAAGAAGVTGADSQRPQLWSQNPAIKHSEHLPHPAYKHKCLQLHIHSMFSVENGSDMVLPQAAVDTVLHSQDAVLVISDALHQDTYASNSKKFSVTCWGHV